jgi:hypothetical protein
MKLIVAVMFLFFAAGCSGTTHTPAYPCPALAIGELLIYPINGATDVQDAGNIIIVGNDAFASPWATLTLTPASGGAPTVSTQIVAVPSPVPDPHATFTPGSATAFHIPALAPQTTYRVDASYPQTPSPCGSDLAPAGSFTTQ